MHQQVDLIHATHLRESPPQVASQALAC